MTAYMQSSNMLGHGPLALRHWCFERRACYSSGKICGTMKCTLERVTKGHKHKAIEQLLFVIKLYEWIIYQRTVICTFTVYETSEFTLSATTLSSKKQYIKLQTRLFSSLLILFGELNKVFKIIMPLYHHSRIPYSTLDVFPKKRKLRGTFVDLTHPGQLKLDISSSCGSQMQTLIIHD